MDLQTPIEAVPFIGTMYAKKLEKLEIFTVGDLLYHIPTRHEDTSEIMHIQDIFQTPRDLYTIQGTIVDIENIYTRYGKKLTQAVIEDETGLADIIWFNQPYIAKSLPKQTQVILSGKVSFDSFTRPKFISPTYEILKSAGSIHLGKLTPIYSETKGVSSKWLRSRVHEVVEKASITEWLPDEILDAYRLQRLPEAIHNIHFPKTHADFSDALQRIAFDEMLLVQLVMKEKRQIARQASAFPIGFNEKEVKRYTTSLSFSLTPSQEQAINEILTDIAKENPMNRLLEGEVGSGKTVVAGAAIYAAVTEGKRAAIMTPTSILAKQHYDTFINLFSLLGLTEEDISLVTTKSKAKKDAKVFIGTQAILFKQSLIDTIDLAIVDEQHRFGVHQRDKIINSQGKVIHSLTMTATPIPRTLALSIYGDLDISYLRELPKGRKPIMTRIVPSTKRDDMYEFVKKQLDDGRQAFIVCPLISLSDKLNVKSAEEEFALLQAKVFKQYKLVLLHGQMSIKQKDEILEDFKAKKYDILVSTPVVEVGIDIPNANVMIIEGAERFGLAQLHQLRGRVGRGEYASYCFLLTSSDEEIERLKVFEKNTSGLKIAEFDLQNRGPGEVYGIRQSGMPSLKAASLLDVELIKITREATDILYQKGLEAYPSIMERLIVFKHSIDKLN